MFVRKGIFGALSMLLVVAAAQLPARAQIEAQTEAQTTAQDLAEGTDATENIQLVEATQPETVAVESAAAPMVPVEGAAALTYPNSEEPLELAQSRRRRTQGVANSSFIGIGGDIGYADDISFAVISKIAFANRLAVRPSVLFGDDVAVLVPVTYDFRQYAPEAGGFRIIPYGGVGAAYSSGDGDDSDINLLLSAGVDVPVTRQITVNAQANLGLFNDTDFGVTVGAAYNIGNLF
jgi:outer membrane protein W